MTYQKLSHTTRQHTVPKCYLKNFSDDGKKIFKKLKRAHTTLEDVDKEFKNPVSLKSATVVEDIYTVKNGREPMLVETLIYAREIEQRYPKIYQQLLNSTVQGFNMEERTWILICLLSLHCRTPKQFNLFEATIPESSLYELDKIKEDYKAAHLSDVLPNVISAHQFKRIIIAKITDTSEFITSDNPVLIIGTDSELKTNIYREQFNMDNVIYIPLDKKHCCIITHALDKNGVNANGIIFYNRIERMNVGCAFAQNINWKMLQNADKCYYGSEDYMKGFFSFYTLTDKLDSQ
jgi:hypothetical protein